MEMLANALVRTLFLVNVISSFRFAVANNISSSSTKTTFVDPDEEPSTLLTKVSYNDLFDLFGGANVADAVHDEGGSHRKEWLAECLRENLQKINPFLQKIEEAFVMAKEGTVPALGFLEVTDLPIEMVNLRKRLLPRASELANLPAEELRALEKPETGYSIGWSHGRESFRIDDNNGTDSIGGTPKRRYDTAKGSFYLNPFADANTTNFPPPLQPFFEADLLKMTRFMFEVGLWIAILCDLYLDGYRITNPDCSREQEPASWSNDESISCVDYTSLPMVVYNSLKYGKSAAKARLLYYFPREQQQEQENKQISAQIDKEHVYDDWCGWHTDHGTLTALLPGMLRDGNDDSGQREVAKPVLPPSHPKPGLYIKTTAPIMDGIMDNAKSEQQLQPKNRERLVHVNLAPNSLGFQLGETLEILSRGKFVATPHAVKAPPASTTTGESMLGRASLAVFLQPLASQVLPPMAATAMIDRENGSTDDNHHRENSGDASSLHNRWRSTFGEFQRVTIESFS